MRSCWLISASCLALVGVAPAHAQSDQRSQSSGSVSPSAIPAGATAETSAEVTPAGQLGDIVVTAQRKSESLQRAAVTVNVAQGAELIAAGITEPYRLSELAPGLTVEPTGAGNLIFIRGVGNLTTTPNSDPATAFNYDGVYIGRPTATNGLFFDLDRVEVLKGPQGTLYGRNATGGAINVIPTQPKLGEFSGYATGSYGNYNTRTLEGAINAPLGDDGAMRISGSIAQHDGYLKDGTYDNDTKSLRVQLKARLTPNLTVRMAGDYAHVGGSSFAAGYLGTYTSSPAGNVFNSAGLPLSEGIFTPAAQAYRTSLIAGTAKRPYDPVAPFPYHKDNFFGVNAQIDWQTPIGTLTVIPAWRYSALDSKSNSGFFYRLREKDEQFSLEARLTGHRIGMFDYVLGAFYYDEDIKSRISVSVQSVTSFPGLNHYHTKSLAPFARLTANVTDRLRVVGGARYTRDIKSFVGTTVSFQIICVAPSCPNVPLLPPVDYFTDYPFPIPATAGVVPYAPGALLGRGATRNDNTSLVNKRTTYHGGVEFDIARQSLLYATVETGYRAGGFNPATGFETYAPEYITAYTIGSKNRFFDNRVQLNIEAFLWNYRNQQVSHVGVDLSTPPRAANFTQNVGRSRIKGVEVEGRVLITPTTLVSADVQYLDAKYLSFSYPQLFTGTAPLTGCPTSVNGTLVTVDCSGRQALNSPKWTINLAAQQTIPLGEYKIVGGVDSHHLSSRYVGFDYLPQQLVGPTWTTNAQLTFGPKNDRWSISGFVRNIENRRITLNEGIVPTTTIVTAGTSAPRTYGVRASVKF
jgi:iron complex outermembrane receptor protein